MNALTAISRTAHAKINLCLHVTGQRDDGYHLLDTIVTFAEIGDQLTFENGDGVSLEISGPEAEGLVANGSNLVIKAADALANVANEHRGAKIELCKNLPVSSGIGGGSADAAATLVGLNDLWTKEYDSDALSKIGLSLGADVPMCLHGKPLRASGIGEQLEPVSMPAFSMVLVNPRVGVSTPEIFKALVKRDNPPAPRCPDSDDLSEWVSWLSRQRNDLQSSAIALHPSIQTALDSLETCASLLARMSGSGATCFGLFENDAQAAATAETIADQHPDWWVVATRSIV
ncbi:MAG: 4-(cytidine 5'-diphospho)-2-C-methyl-D-erythritol kinase [Pseudomonadota bacterium]